MKIGAFEILLFFICLNLSCFILNEMEALPYYIEPVETVESINAQFVTTIGGAIAIIGGGVFAGLLIGAIVQAAAIALVIAALSFLVPLFDWIIMGFPKMLIALGVPEPIYLALGVLVGVTWVWFLIGIVAQRYME